MGDLNEDKCELFVHCLEWQVPQTVRGKYASFSKLWSLLLTKKWLTSGQSYKASKIVIYDSRVVPDLKIPHIMTLES